MPSEDEEVISLFSEYRDRFKKPLKPSDVDDASLGDGFDYIGAFIHGGSGAVIGLPESDDMRAVPEWAAPNDKFINHNCPPHFTLTIELTPLTNGTHPPGLGTSL